LIPFGGKDNHRIEVLKWLIRYWKHELPDAEIIIGRSFEKPFHKTAAFNNAARRARGKVLVLLDADAYIPGKYIERAADKILENIEERLWFVPYRKLYRLTRECTTELLCSNPENPMPLPNPLPPECIDGDPAHSNYGRRYGAMCLVIPRQAYEVLGCFDEKFNKGWGSEDFSILRALDTLWGKHKSLNTAIYHLWHPMIGHKFNEKKWPGQKDNMPHGPRAAAYNRATGHPVAMRKLVKEGTQVGLRRKLLILIDRLFGNRILSDRK
jgi:hypothetical protein